MLKMIDQDIADVVIPYLLEQSQHASLEKQLLEQYPINLHASTSTRNTREHTRHP